MSLNFIIAPKPFGPVDFPALDSSQAQKCYFDASKGKARLEMPPDAFLVGFSPEWIAGELPKDISRMIGVTTPIFK